MNKKLRSLVIFFPFALGIAGCNSTESSSELARNSNLDESDGLVCKMEKRIGSNRMTRVCYTAEEREAMEEAAREGWNRLQRSSETSNSDGL